MTTSHPPAGLRELWRYLAPSLRPHLMRLVWAFFALIASVAAQVARPWPLKLVIDYVLGDETAPALLAGWSASTLLLGCAVAFVVLAFIQGQSDFLFSYWAAKSGQQAVLDIRSRLFEHVQRLSLRYHQNHESGDLLSRMVKEVNQLRDFLTDSAMRIIGESAYVAVMVAVLFWIDAALAFSGLLTLAMAAVLIRVYSGRIQTLTRKRLRREGQAASIFHETLGAIQEVQLFGGGDDLFERLNTKSYRADMKALRARGALMRWVETLTALSVAVVLWFGAKRAMTGALTIGDLVVVITYLRAIYKPVRRIARLTMQASKARVSAERVVEILATEPEIQDAPDAVPAPRFAGRIRFREVSFAYSQDRPVLDGLNLVVEPGQTVALVGKSGAGKSTFLSLIPRLYDPSSGAIEIDGIDLRKYQVDSLRSRIAVVPQTAVLFSTSIAENIALGMEHCDDEAIRRAARLAHATEFIERLPDGYDTLVGERGARLSGGQRQRIAIARAILRDTPVVLLDEPFSGLDAESEQAVHRGLEALLKNRTALVIAHRLTTLLGADQVVVFDRGRIVEVGKPLDLLAANGRFRELAELQIDDRITRFAAEVRV